MGSIFWSSLGLVLSVFTRLSTAMDMPDESGNSPNWNLTLSDPNCIDKSCEAFLNAETESQATITWAGQFRYGHWATYGYLAILGILMVVHLTRKVLDNRSSSPSTSSTSLWQKSYAFGKYVSYRRFTSRWLVWLGLPSMGMLGFLICLVVFATTLTFAIKPYYRAHLEYGSPPLGTRTGLMAFACTPILVALSGKANAVTLLTGISHEKLNIVHRWVAWISFGLSIAHTIPFLAQSAWDAPFYHVPTAENVATQFYYWGKSVGASEYSGVPPLAILFALCVLSLPYIRTHFYESFYAAHILLGITYLGLLFWHAMNILDSWVYLWATLALWLSSYLARLFIKMRPMSVTSSEPWFVGSPTTLTSLPGGMTRVDVLAPGGFKWSPSQHCFLRFPQVSKLDSHPFTIVSSPSPNTGKDLNSTDILSFLIHTHSGFTLALWKHLQSNPQNAENIEKGNQLQTSTWIDGPYGGIPRPVHKLYDTLILIAGGSGITAVMPWLSFLASQARAKIPIRTKRVVFLWTMRDTSHFAWIQRELDLIRQQSLQSLEIIFQFHVTHEPSSTSPTPQQSGLGLNTLEKSQPDSSATLKEEELSLSGKSSSSSSPVTEMQNLGQVQHVRPDMSHIIQTHIMKGEKNLVIGCGPLGLRIDLGNAVAQAQKQVMNGDVREIGMHLEAFDF